MVNERVARLYLSACIVLEDAAWCVQVVRAADQRDTRCIVCVNRRRGGRWHRCHRLPLCGQKRAHDRRTHAHSRLRRFIDIQREKERDRERKTERTSEETERERERELTMHPPSPVHPSSRSSMSLVTERVGVQLSSASYPPTRISNSVAKRTLARVSVRCVLSESERSTTLAALSA